MGVANTVYLVGIVNLVQVTLTNVRCGFGTVGGTGHFDVGIYDATGTNGAPNNLLAHAAATNTTLATTNGVQTPTLIGGNIILNPARYWLALWIDNAVDLINRETSRQNLGVVMSGTNAGPLPALASSITSLGNGTLKPLLIGLITGGWS